MNENEIDPLENSLNQLTWWSGPAPKLWKRALASANLRTNPGRITRFLRTPWPWIGVPIAAVLVAAVFVCDQGEVKQMSSRIDFAKVYQDPAAAGATVSRDLELKTLAGEIQMVTD